MHQDCRGVVDMDELSPIQQVGKLAGCSCYASQIWRCHRAEISDPTNAEILRLNEA